MTQQKGSSMTRIWLIALGLALAAGSAAAQDKKPFTAAEMQALLSKGLTVSSSDVEGGKVFTARITLAADGRLSGALTPAGDKAIPVSGVWKLKGAQVCRTLEPIQAEEICETWLKSGAKEATIVVGGKEASINRW
jgi:hypothetical protein